MTVSFEMVLPGLAGYWLDQRLGTGFAFTVVGFGAGMAGGMWHLMRMTGRGDDSDHGDDQRQ